MSRDSLARTTIGIVIGIAGLGRPVRAQERVYRSPYRVEFTLPMGELIGDLERTERGDRRLQSDLPFADWYSRSTLARWQAWGPFARHYPAPDGLARWTAERKRQRVVAVAMRFLGYGYQHHHVPDWDPPPQWPWKPTVPAAMAEASIAAT